MDQEIQDLNQTIVIWTTRQAGGGKLSRSLTSSYGLEHVESHSLDEKGSFERALSRLLETKARQPIKQEADRLCGTGVVLIHCLDCVPWESSLAFFDSLRSRNCKHVILYRESSADRLLSLHEKFGLQAGQAERSTSKDLLSVFRQTNESKAPKSTQVLGSVEDMCAKEEVCIRYLSDIYQMLDQHKLDNFAISYEQLFESPKKQTRLFALSLIHFLGISENLVFDRVSSHDDFIAALLSARSRIAPAKETRRFELDKLKDCLASLTPFRPTNDRCDKDLARFEARSQLINVPFPKGELQRLRARRWILKYAKTGGVGAELGVFRGHFSVFILKALQPKILYLVDPWTISGETYKWGMDSEYTAFGKLTPRMSLQDTRARVGMLGSDSDVRIIEGWAEKFLNGLPEKLDFVYLDTSHKYGQTIAQLRILDEKITDDGVILGDDWVPDPGHKHYGVFQAVQEFVAERDWEIIAAGPANQWCIRRKGSGTPNPAVEMTRAESKEVD
ncbi:MAG: class I SAM-dependent methyltransferase [Chromatiaceae bacterium]|nr:class I SAM-dependent methyltransferase [Gammaproteobacteria bacterium]MCP5414662.1 class I SAM-dependent methyltransferase [Chromatiaceae bacterium]MCP5439063.1 class I SAM-dependent methyltransferase [Chromatiaceae bacterium]HPQ23904.1 class I SAM-dependent methyltransferase [Gammaproteobacteria bacterium]